MLRVALGQAGLAEAQLVLLGSELQRAIAQQRVLFAVIRFAELDVDPLGTQGFRADAGQLLQPAGDDRIHHKAVVGVVRADGVEA
ncbi:hypothetical protein D3C78_718390 [compost metagenome]